MPALTFDLEDGPLFDYFAQFLSYLHYVSHDRSTLQQTQDALRLFKEQVETLYFTLHRTQFTTPKYHVMEHYGEQIRKFGSLLNGDTESTERLHVYIKKAYKLTNKKVECFFYAQMLSRLLTSNKGNWVSQIANNLQETLQLKLLYDLRIRLPQDHNKPNHALKGEQQKTKLMSTASDPCIQRWKPRIMSYLREQIPEGHQDALKISVYNTLVCQYTDINNEEKLIEQTARAAPRWAHRSEGAIYDFVAINSKPQYDGLAGIEVARLSIIFRIDTPNGTCYELVGVQLCERGEDHGCILPVYRMTTEHRIFPAQLVARSLHMVPKWDERVIDMSEEEEANDLYDQYEAILLNIHSDNAIWNQYYDVE